MRILTLVMALVICTMGRAEAALDESVADVKRQISNAVAGCTWDRVGSTDYCFPPSLQGPYSHGRAGSIDLKTSDGTTVDAIEIYAYLTGAGPRAIEAGAALEGFLTPFFPIGSSGGLGLIVR
jgi:hypothetical protein